MWRVLVVDDEETNCKLITEILNERALCHVALSGREAADAFQKAFLNNTPYDIILLDNAMPVMSGLEVLQEIRRFEAVHDIPLGEGIPIIMVTAFKKDFMKAFKSGCDDYILKPIDADKLISKIEHKVKSAFQA
ncbi:MAG: response regulator [Candidatus Riflebacteria bacterium]|nr:response regulator [Candidatus Riflebacteria bacterium]